VVDLRATNYDAPAGDAPAGDAPAGDAPDTPDASAGDGPGRRADDVTQIARIQLLLDRFPLVSNHPDVSGLLRDGRAFAALGPALAGAFTDRGVTAVCAPEARGPILGALVARELGVGLILVRKAERNHPGADLHYSVGPTWRGTTEAFQARSSDLHPTDVVLAVDDWVTTGSTLRGIRDLVESSGADYAGASVLVNKATDDLIADLKVTPLLGFDQVMARKT